MAKIIKYEPLRVAVVGIAGRMGRAVAEIAANDGRIEVVAGVSHGKAEVGGRICDLGLPGEAPIIGVVGDLPEIDALIDFSAPDAIQAVARAAVTHEAALITGTTGLDAGHRAVLARASGSVAVMASPNMSVGVNLLFALCRVAAARLDRGWDVEIIEMHHNQKADAPSGTAARLLDVIARARGGDPSDTVTHGRFGHLGPRPAGEIGVHAIRGGDVAGEHQVLFMGDGELVELVHRASDRRIFARGAIQAARWAVRQTPGLYTMADVLGL